MWVEGHSLEKDQRVGGRRHSLVTGRGGGEEREEGRVVRYIARGWGW